MAKKGGISEINGFVSVKNEDSKSSTKKTVSRSDSKSRQKDPSSTKKTNGALTADSKEIKQSGNSVIKRTVEKDPKKATKVNQSVSQNSKIKSTVKSTNVSTVSNRTVVPRTSKPVSTETSSKSIKVKPTQDASSKSIKVKPTQDTSKGPSSSRGLPERKEKMDIKTKSSAPQLQKKEIRKDDAKRKEPLAKNSVNSPPVKSRGDSLRKPADPGSKKVPQTSSLRSEGTRKSVSQPSVNSSVSTKNLKSSSSTNKSSSKPTANRDITTIKITTKDNSNISITESDVKSNKKDVSSDEINIKTVHKESMYFEIDMGTNTHQAERSNKSQESVPLQPPPISRQGTFTKDDDESKENSILIVPQSNSEPQASEDEEYNYEDDFEDYESDFEEYVSESGVSSDTDEESLKVATSIKSPIQTSATARTKPVEKTVEEERKLDSGIYDLTNKTVTAYSFPQSLKQKQLDQIKEAITKENTQYSEREKIVKPQIENTRNDVLDFVDALKRQGAESAKKEKKNRSTLILEKIKLHEQQITIFEEGFLYFDNDDSIYNNHNVAHVASEAAVIIRNEEIQTDNIDTLEKWTQFPSSFHKWNKAENPLEAYVEDYRGFGGDNVEVNLDAWLNPYYNPEKLYNFVESAGQVILIMLEEEERWKTDSSVSVMKAKHDHGFSRGYIPMQTKKLQFLKNRPICDIMFSPHNQNIFISSHRFVKDIENLSSFEDQFLGRSILCLWNILEPSQPLSMFVASCQISAISFDFAHINLLYGGLTDGSVCLWDIHERSMLHKETIAGAVGGDLLRTPSYCSSYLLGEDLHNNVIVAIQSLGYENSKSSSREKFIPSEVLTLDSDGKIIIWVAVLTANKKDDDFSFDKEDFGQTFWSKYKLVPSRTLNPVNNLPIAQNTWSLQFLCMSLAPPHSDRGVLVGTNTGCVVHCILSEEKTVVPVYNNKEETDSMISILSIEKCPHESSVFLAGCSNGTVRIHLMERKRPVRILIMESQLRGSPITKIRWSSLGAGLFFILDKNLSLHLWDLCKKESSPLVSLSLKKMKATHFDISADHKFVYLALVVHKERLEIHRVNEQLTPVGGDNNKKDIEVFLDFVDRCCY